MKVSKLKLRLIAVCLIAIALLSMFQDQLCIKIDAATTLTLVIATILFILPNIKALTKLKFWDVEMEFNPDLDKLETLVEKEEVEPTTTTTTIPRSETSHIDTESMSSFYADYKALYNSSSSNLEKTLRASQLVEQMISLIGRREIDIRTGSPYLTMQNLRSRNIISQDEWIIYEEYTTLRNKIIHGNTVQLDDVTVVRFLDLSYRIVRIFYLRFP